MVETPAIDAFLAAYHSGKLAQSRDKIVVPSTFLPSTSICALPLRVRCNGMAPATRPQDAAAAAVTAAAAAAAAVAAARTAVGESVSHAVAAPAANGPVDALSLSEAATSSSAAPKSRCS